jgi:hypothetical protein
MGARQELIPAYIHAWPMYGLTWYGRERSADEYTGSRYARRAFSNGVYGTAYDQVRQQKRAAISAAGTIQLKGTK